VEIFNMSEEQGLTDPVLEEPSSEDLGSEDQELQMDDEIDELHFESHPVEGTASPMSDTTPSMEEDTLSIKGESVPKPFGSVATLDTIALETSPTMESLDLGDTKSLDRECIQFEGEKEVLEEASEEVCEEENHIDVSLGGENVTLGEVDDLQKEMDGISLNDTVPAVADQHEPVSEVANVEEGPF
jgi:hypothetical protein